MNIAPQARDSTMQELLHWIRGTSRSLFETFVTKPHKSETNRLITVNCWHGGGSSRSELDLKLYTINEAQKQHSLLDTIFDYIFYFEPPGKYL